MSTEFSGKPLVVGISSRALLHLEREDAIYKSQGRQAFIDYQREHRNDLIPKGVAFPLIKALLDVNARLKNGSASAIEVVIISRNHPDCGFRIQNSLAAYEIDIPRAAFTGGTAVIRELTMFEVDLFLSYEEDDVVAANEAGVSSAKIFGGPADPLVVQDDVPLIAFDGDSTLFSNEGDLAFTRGGLTEFARVEFENLAVPLPPGPMYRFVKALATLQQLTSIDNPPFRIALVTARNFYFMRRPIETLNTWGIRLDKAYAVGTMSKSAVLRELGALMFFDDSTKNCADVAGCAPTALIPPAKVKEVRVSTTIGPIAVNAEARLDKFTKLCKLVLRKEYGSHEKTLITSYEATITQFSDSVFDAKMEEFQRSISGIPKGQFLKERQASGTENSRLAKLKLFLANLFDPAEDRDF